MKALQWALAQPADSQARALADAYLSGVKVVMVEGRRVEYATMSEVLQAISNLHAAMNPSRRRPSATVARVWG